MGLDAARGVALIGVMSVPLLSGHDGEFQGPGWFSVLFSGYAVALLALLAGVGLALGSGGRFPHTGRWLLADRVGVAVRAVLIVVVGLGIAVVMPRDVLGESILIYYGVFFVLAIPFLHLGPRALFVCAAVFWIVGPVLLRVLSGVLPAAASSSPTVADVVGRPAAIAAQVLLTGTYPGLCYLTYLLVGMGVGRLGLGAKAVQVRLLVVGIGVVIFARAASSFLLYARGGYGRLPSSSAMDLELEEAFVGGPLDGLPPDTAWWWVVDAPHTNTSWAIASSLGVGLLVLAVLLLGGSKGWAWVVPLSAMGAMTLSLYTAHLVALSWEVRDGLPHLWCVVHLGTAAVFALAWQRALGQGPLERGLSTSVSAARRTVLHRFHRSHRSHWLHRL